MQSQQNCFHPPHTCAAMQILSTNLFVVGKKNDNKKTKKTRKKTRKKTQKNPRETSPPKKQQRPQPPELLTKKPTRPTSIQLCKEKKNYSKNAQKKNTRKKNTTTAHHNPSHTSIASSAFPICFFPLLQDCVPRGDMCLDCVYCES